MNQFFPFHEGDSLANSEIYKLAKSMENNHKDGFMPKILDRPLANDVKEYSEDKGEVLWCTPERNGHWDGGKGDSTWHPDSEYVPPEKGCDKPYSNPDKLSWEEILKKYNLDGIDFRDGFPVFDEVSKGTVEIEDFETGGNKAKNHNFAEADRALAEQKGCTPQEVKDWRKENNYTWHECEDKRTMQKVPNEVHANIPHDGGRSQ